jgi:hypothetical protein
MSVPTVRASDVADIEVDSSIVVSTVRTSGVVVAVDISVDASIVVTTVRTS